MKKIVKGKLLDRSMNRSSITEIIRLARETQEAELKERADAWLFEIKMESLGVEVKPC